MPQDDSSKSDHEVIVRKLILSDLHVEIRGAESNPFIKVPPRKYIKRLEFRNVSSKKGFPTKELIRAIFQGAGIEQYIKEIFSPENIIRQLRRSGLFGENKGIENEAGEV